MKRMKSDTEIMSIFSEKVREITNGETVEEIFKKSRQCRLGH